VRVDGNECLGTIAHSLGVTNSLNHRLHLFRQWFIMSPTSVGRGHYKMMGGVRLSVCRVPRPRERKGLGSPKLAGWKPGNLWTYLEAKRSKVSVTSSINAVTDNAPHAGRGIAIYLKLACSQSQRTIVPVRVYGCTPVTPAFERRPVVYKPLYRYTHFGLRLPYRTLEQYDDDYY